MSAGAIDCPGAVQPYWVYAWSFLLAPTPHREQAELGLDRVNFTKWFLTSFPEPPRSLSQLAPGSPQGPSGCRERRDRGHPIVRDDPIRHRARRRPLRVTLSAETRAKLQRAQDLMR